MVEKLAKSEMKETEGIKFNECIKKLLSEPQSLARIISTCIDEYRNWSYERIIEFLGNVEFVRMPEEPGFENVTMSGNLSHEDSVAGEKLAEYDILTWISVSVKLPFSKTDYVKLYINIETQQKERAGCNTPEKGIFYKYRELSRQYEKEFSMSSTNPEKYGGLKKVYSIWICPEAPEECAGTIETISLEKEVTKGDVTVSNSKIEDQYDIMGLKIVRLSKNPTYARYSGRQNELMCFLAALFNNDMSKQEKLDTLAEYGVNITKTIAEEVRQMTAYSPNNLEKNMAKGVVEDIAQDVTQGMIQGIVQGKAEERSLLTKVFNELKAGKTVDELLVEGYDKETVETALAFYRG